MPGSITHLKTAYFYNVKHGSDNEGKLYLGSIVPDSVNIDGHAPKSLRWPAHLRDGNLDIWQKNAVEFYKARKFDTDADYLKGYILHILTDIVWDRSFDMSLYALLSNSGVPENRLKECRWEEIYAYERTQFGEKWLKEDCLPKLGSAVAEDIGTLDKATVERWKRKVCLLENESKKPPEFVDEEFMNGLFNSVILLAEGIF